MSQFPTAIDDPSTLFVPADSFSTKTLTTTMAALCLSTDTDILLSASVSSLGAPGSYGIVSIEDEQIVYTGTSLGGTQLNGCLRGQFGTTAVGHANATPVRWRYVARFDKSLQDAVIAVETALGVTGAFNFVSSLVVNKQTGTSYSLTDANHAQLVTGTNGSAQAYSLISAATARANFFVIVENRGAGSLTITPTTSTIDGSGTLVLTTNQGVILFSDGTNYFTMRGIGGSGTPAGSSGDIQFNSSGSFGADTGQLFWDSTNNRLGIGTASPSYTVDVHSAPAASGVQVRIQNTGANNALGLALDASSSGNNNLGFTISGVTKASFAWDVSRTFWGVANYVYSSSDFSLRVNSDGSLTYHDGATGTQVFKVAANGDVTFLGVTLTGLVTDGGGGLGSPGSDTKLATEKAIVAGIAGVAPTVFSLFTDVTISSTSAGSETTLKTVNISGPVNGVGYRIKLHMRIQGNGSSGTGANTYTYNIYFGGSQILNINISEDLKLTSEYTHHQVDILVMGISSSAAKAIIYLSFSDFNGTSTHGGTVNNSTDIASPTGLSNANVEVKGQGPATVACVFMQIDQISPATHVE